LTPAALLPEGLLVDVQRSLEALYALPAEAPVTDFVIPEGEAQGLPGGGSRTLVAQDGDCVSVGVVFADGLGHSLRVADPRVRLCVQNLGDFSALTEEVSHFLYVLYCARASRSTTELELELQGEIDKYLTAAFFLSLQNEGAVSVRLRELMFQGFRLAAGLSSEQTERYRAANALAFRYCGYLERHFLRGSRLADLAREARRFYRLGRGQKLERIAAVS
jgi:hypothetical protein